MTLVPTLSQGHGSKQKVKVNADEEPHGAAGDAGWGTRIVVSVTPGGAAVSGLTVVADFNLLGRMALSPAQEIAAVTVFVYIAFFLSIFTWAAIAPLLGLCLFRCVMHCVRRCSTLRLQASIGSWGLESYTTSWPCLFS